MDIKKIEELVKIVEKANIAELEITLFFGRKIKISKVGSAQLPTVQTIQPPVQIPSKESTESPKKEESVKESKEKIQERKNLVAIKAPMVGTFYRAPAPDAPPYVEVGDIVKKGQVLCIIEAMKVMNEIESDVDGKIVDILVENAQPVEFGQELFLIEPLS